MPVHSVISIETLPNEILLEIFKRDVSPQVIWMVCSHWRNLALENPELWTRHCINLPMHYSGEWVTANTEGLEKAIREMKLWNSKQANRPVHLFIETEGPGWDPNSRGVSSEHKADVSFYFGKAYAISINCVDGLWELISPGRKPKLEILVSTSGNMTRGDFLGASEYGFNIRFPSLRRLSASSTSNRSGWDGPWIFTCPGFVSSPSITHLALHDVTFTNSMWFGFIRSLPCLQWAHFDLVRCEMNPSHGRRPFDLVFLKELYVNIIIGDIIDNSHTFSVLLGGLRFPVLNTLFLRSDSPSWFGHDPVAAGQDVSTILQQVENLTTLNLSTSLPMAAIPISFPSISRFSYRIGLQIVIHRHPTPHRIEQARQIAFNLSRVICTSWNSVGNPTIELLFLHQDAEALRQKMTWDCDIPMVLVQSPEQRNCVDNDDIFLF